MEIVLILKKLLYAYSDDIIERIISTKFILALAAFSFLLLHFRLDYLVMLVLLTPSILLLVISIYKFLSRTPFREFKSMLACHIALFISLALFCFGILSLENYLHTFGFKVYLSNIFWIILGMHIFISFFFSWFIECLYIVIVDGLLKSSAYNVAVDFIITNLLRKFSKVDITDKDVEKLDVKRKKQLTYGRFVELFYILFILIGIIISTNAYFYIHYWLEHYRNFFSTNQEELIFYKEIMLSNIELYKQLVVVSFALFLFRHYYLKFKNLSNNE